MPIADKQWFKWQNILKPRMREKRYEHCLRVAEEAVRLARHYSLDEERARLAGLSHDVARDLSFDELFACAARYGITAGPEEAANPVILHAPVGAALLRRELGLEDEAVLTAVALHTVAAPGMDAFSQLLYLADIIEPGRQEWPGLEALRELSYQHLGRAMLYALKENFRYLEDSHTFIHPRALQAYDFFAQQLKEQESAEK